MDRHEPDGTVLSVLTEAYAGSALYGLDRAKEGFRLTQKIISCGRIKDFCCPGCSALFGSLPDVVRLTNPSVPRNRVAERRDRLSVGGIQVTAVAVMDRKMALLRRALSQNINFRALK